MADERSAFNPRPPLQVGDLEECRIRGRKLTAVARLLAGYDARESEVEALRKRVEKLDIRRREGRQLLRRFVKYAREDRAKTDGSTRLERLTAQVGDYLRRTEDPNDILRASSTETDAG